MVETEKGNYINITSKNRIIRDENILDYIKTYKNINNKDIQNQIKETLFGHSFTVFFEKRNLKIDYILFERNPNNQPINYENFTLYLVTYYEKVHKIKIKEMNQPLILVRSIDSQGDLIDSYYIPELCTLCGLNDEIVEDYVLMKELNHATKLEPTDIVKNYNYFINLFRDPFKEKDKNKLSSKEKSELYGIEIRPFEKQFKGYFIEETKFIDGNNKLINPNSRIFPILDKIEMTKWLCFYEKKIIMKLKNFIRHYLRHL